MKEWKQYFIWKWITKNKDKPFNSFGNLLSNDQMKVVIGYDISQLDDDKSIYYHMN